MNCKAGDLAIIIADNCPENLGAIVEVCYLDLDSTRPPGMIGPSWYIRSSGRLLKADHIMRNGQTAYRAWVREAYIEDSSLRPITGIPDAESTSTVKELETV